MISVRSSGVVYRNPQPEVFARHAWHPSLVRLGAGRWLCTFDIGQAPESHDYLTHVSHSDDDGRSWSAPRPLAPAGRPPRATHSIRVARLRSGDLLGAGARFVRSDPAQGLINHPGIGYTDVELVTTVSTDGGATWSPLTVVAPPIQAPAFETCHAPYELADGTLIWPTSTWLGWDGVDDPAGPGMQAVCFVSTDGGRTWPAVVRGFDQWRDGIVSWEQSVAQLADGRLVAVVWSLDLASGVTHPTRYALAQPGHDFGPAGPNGLAAQTMKLGALGGSRLLAVYRRHDDVGLWASTARVEGADWVTEESARLWAGAAAGMSGEGPVGRELSALRFGYPSVVVESPTSAAVAFWCQEDDIYGIRLLRLDLPG